MALKVVYLNDFASLDPAQKVLLQEEDAKKRRQREETKIQLERIHDRVSFTLGRYEHGEMTASVEPEVEVSFEKVEDPMQLYKLLADAKMRSKYEKHLTIVLMGFEQQREKQEQVLHSLGEFFQDAEAGNTAQIIEQVAAEEIDFNEATSGIESALTTASEAAGRLVKIKEEIGQLLAVVSQFSDNKKGRRKLEKALVKAQEDAKVLTSTLEAAQAEVEQKEAKCTKLQKLMEVKTAECEKLKKSSDQVVSLQADKDRLEKEAADLLASLEKSKAEVERLQKLPVPSPLAKQLPVVDETKLRELEEALAAAATAKEELAQQAQRAENQYREELAQLQLQYEEEMAVLRSQHQEQMQEQQARHEEQLHSLAETDLFDHEEDQEEDGEEVDEENVTGNGMQTEEKEVSPSKGRSTPLAVESEATPETAREVDILKAEVQDVKNRSSKLVTSLRAQLTELQNKQSSHLKVKDDEIAMLTRSLSELQEQQQVLNRQIKDLQEESCQLQQQCEEYTARIHELNEQLALQQKQLEESSLLPPLPAPSPPPLQVQGVKELADHSTQWSDSASSFSARSSHLVLQEEVMYSPKPSLHASSLLTGSATESIVLSVANAPTSSPPQPFGSAISIGDSSDYPHFPGMAPSRISKQGFAQELITADHPLVAEWSKMYELFRKFREEVVERLVAVKGEAAVEELIVLDPFDLDTSKDLTGQITQMRFTLTLALHQLETSLQEHLTTPDVATSMEESGKGEADHLKLQVTKLQQLLRQAEERHHSELRDSKDTITNLSLKVENLKAELANLHNHVAQLEGSSGVAFFTQLDADRNEKALQQAVATHQLSVEEYDRISHDMTEYLSIPSQRLAHITRQLTYNSQARHTMRDVEQSLHPRHAAHVIGMLQCIQKKRQEEFEATMEDLTSRRQQLSVDMQSRLTNVESDAGLFLIKPIYPIKHQLPQSLIVPLHRSPPPRSRPPSMRPITTDAVTCHPTVGLVSKARNTTAHSRRCNDTLTMGSEKPQHDRETEETNGATWSVASSRVQSAKFPCSPVLPRFVELETRKMREPSKLLGHLVRRHASSVPQPVKQREYTTLPPIHMPHHS